MAKRFGKLREAYLAHRLARFGNDRSGTIAVLFALILVPLLMVVGMSIDYGHATTYQTSMQRVLDEAVIAGATAFAKTNNASQAETATQRRFSATKPDAYEIKLRVTVDSQTGNVTADAMAHVPMSFMTLSGYKHLKVAAHAMAASKRATPRRQVASNSAAGQSRMPVAPQLSDAKIRDLIDRVERLCYQLRGTGFADRVPQCRAVFDGTFANQLRSRLASTGDATGLLPSGVRLVQ